MVDVYTATYEGHQPYILFYSMVHVSHLMLSFMEGNIKNVSRVQLKCDGTRRRKGGEVKWKLANGVGSQYPSQYLGTWCIQHYYR